jgi:molybdopterin converting factor small subunit
MTGRQEVTLPDDATIADLIRQLEVDEQLVCLVAVNGRAAEPATLLAEGDYVDLIPPITGGGKHHAFRDRWA